jgi:hypothetical protein
MIWQQASQQIGALIISSGGSPGNYFSQSFEDAAHRFGPDAVGGLTLDNGGGGSPDYTIDTTDGYLGSASALATYSNPPGPGDGGGVMYLNFGTSHPKLYIVAALKWVTVPRAGGVKTKKMVIFRQSGFNTQYGELNCVDGDLQWIWLQDPGATLNSVGAPTQAAALGWKVMKILYDQSTSHPTFTFGYDGVDNLYTQAATAVTGQDAQIIDFGGPLNVSSGACSYKWDYIQIGSVDPGWP